MSLSTKTRPDSAFSGNSFPALVAVAHGSSDPNAAKLIEQIMEQVQNRLFEVQIRHAFVEISRPSLEEVLEESGPKSVVVPLLFSRGHHYSHDILAIAKRFGAQVAPPLGPHQLLVRALEHQLVSAGVPPGTATVLAAAGSSEPTAIADVQTVAMLLQRRLGTQVEVGFASGRPASVESAVGRLRSQGHNAVAVASYLLSPGRFSTSLDTQGANWITAPLGTHQNIVELVVRRYLSQASRQTAQNTIQSQCTSRSLQRI